MTVHPAPVATDAPTVPMGADALPAPAPAAAPPLPPGRYLTVAEGGDVAVLPLRGLTRIGRRPAAELFLDDATVSRRHAIVMLRDGRPVIADDRSLNGVYVNGRRVREAPLRHGDEVRIGARLIRYLEF